MKTFVDTKWGKVSILIFLATVASVCQAQPVDFADPELKAAVEGALGVSNPTQEDMQRLTLFSLFRKGITDLEGLEYATNITHLDLYFNSIRDISPLAALTNLESLKLVENPVSDISALSGLTKLTQLWLHYNQINDISSLASMSRLTELSLGRNSISTISALAGMTNLTTLYLENNNIHDISPLSRLLHLETLRLSGNPIGHISPLSKLDNLVDLQMQTCQLSDMTALSNMTNLRNLVLDENQISDIKALSNIKNLNSLTLSMNQIEDISPLSGLIELTKLNLFNNNIRDISALVNHRNLNYLNLWGNTLNTAAHTTILNQIQANNPVLERGVNFFYNDPVWHRLTVSSSEGGRVIIPGEGTFTYTSGDIILLEAIPDTPGFRFMTWTGTAVDGGMVMDWQHPVTTLTLQRDTAITANFEPRNVIYPALGYSHGKITFPDQAQFDTRIQTNNGTPNSVVAYVSGQEPDPTGYMHMQTLGSPARAKASFEPSSRTRLLIRFKYLFDEHIPGLEIKAYLSDVPDLLSPTDEDRIEHYQEITRISPPNRGRPGAVGSARFGTFEAWIETGGLDLRQGTFIELELGVSKIPVTFASQLQLATSGHGSASIDDIEIEVHCDTGICMDLNWSDTADEEDFMLVLAGSGRSTGLSPQGRGSSYCLEGPFSTNGYVDTQDAQGWCWSLLNVDRLGHYCGIPLALDEPIATFTEIQALHENSYPASLTNASIDNTSLLILGKRGGQEWPDTKLTDSLYGFAQDGRFAGQLITSDTRNNIRLIAGDDGQQYVVNTQLGVCQLDSDGSLDTVLAPGKTRVASDPRYGLEAEVYLGIQEIGNEVIGRPLSDVVIGETLYYAIPVVVKPAGKGSYLAAAQIKPQVNGFTIEKLYHPTHLDNIDTPRNPDLSGLRELEVDTEGNVYVLNAHALNESDMLVRYQIDGTVDCIALGDPHGEIFIPNPIGLTIDSERDRIYIASAIHRSDQVTVVVLSTEDLKPIQTLSVTNMTHVTDITLQPDSTLWIVGFSMGEIPAWPSAYDTPFYEPRLATLPVGITQVEAVSLVGTSDLALPTSILWKGN